jgi:hypothetical protein
MDSYCKPTFIQGDTILQFVCDNWFVVSNFCDQSFFIEYVATCNIWFAARNIHDDKALTHLAKFSSSKIKVGSQYSISLPVVVRLLPPKVWPLRGQAPQHMVVFIQMASKKKDRSQTW